MKIISNRFSLIFYCALFNLLFEYSARGLGEFIHKPLLMLCIFGIYFTYFMMLEDLIVRFRFKNFQIFIAAFLYGLFPIAFLTGNLFNQRIYKGIILADVNIGTLVIVGIFAWGVMQGIVTLYFANRLLARDWNHSKMGPIGWGAACLYQIGIMFLASKNPVTPRGTLLGYIVFSMLLIIGVALLIRSLKVPRPEPRQFQPSKVMDFLAFGSVILFLAFGTFLVSKTKVVTSQPLNLLAVKLENYWVIFCAILFFVYRFLKKSDVAV